MEGNRQTYAQSHDMLKWYHNFQYLHTKTTFVPILHWNKWEFKQGEKRPTAHGTLTDSGGGLSHYPPENIMSENYDRRLIIRIEHLRDWIGSSNVKQNSPSQSWGCWPVLGCSHCGGSRHTKEGCFKLVGYPNWWDDLLKRKAATKAPAPRTGGKANLATTNHPDEIPSSYEQSGMALGKGETTIDELETREREEYR